MPKVTDVIAAAYGRRVPEGWNSRHGTEAIPSPDALCGIELEIEGWQWDRDHPGFRFTEDGSLRPDERGNPGIEAVTEPVRLMHAPGLLRSFFHRFPVVERNYSERCSIHVHLNVNDMTYEQVGAFSLVYQTLERLLFGFVGHDRDKNIFCVPWSQSGINYKLVSEMAYDPHGLARRWQKYTALNLQPITTQGTIEFRHLHGTNDVELITNWLRLLGRMREYTLRKSMAELTNVFMEMNTVSNYGAWLDDVFQQDAVLLRRQPDFEKKLAAGVVDTKYMLVQPEVPLKKSAKEIPGYVPGGLDWGNIAGLNENAQQADQPVPAAGLARPPVRPRVQRAWLDDLPVAEQQEQPAEQEPVDPVEYFGRNLQWRRRGPNLQPHDYWSVFGEARVNPGEQVITVREGLSLHDAMRARAEGQAIHQRLSREENRDTYRIRAIVNQGN